MPMCLLAALCARAATGASDDDEKKRVPLYTNEDLRRVAPYRDETGVNSKPAVAPAPPALSPERRRGEGYWRREADRLRDRLRPLRERSAELRLRIEERRRRPRSSLLGDPELAAMERRRRALDERIREAEARLEDRARRERALPGWLR